MTIEFREYDPDRDFACAARIWREVGWLGKDEGERLRWYAEESRGVVAVVDGEVECFVLMTDGRLRYQESHLPMAACTGVTTGRAARRLGLARRALARSLVGEVRRGALVAGLGVFEVGFYDALGYGSGSCQRWAQVDPAHLRIGVRPRPAARLTPDDWEEMHAARIGRRRCHGVCDLLPACITRSEVADGDRGFGLGYRDAAGGRLSHFVYFTTGSAEQGPYRAELIYRTVDELRELLALVKSLGDQVLSVTLREPPGMILQDWLDRPFRHMNVTEGGKHEWRIRSAAYHQFRILDLQRCVGALRLPGANLSFNLRLTDPMEAYAEETSWSGLGGDYIISFGEVSTCSPGANTDLPTLHASVNAFTRLWLGVGPASGLQVADDLNAPAELLQSLDDVLRLPVPQPDWDF